MNESNLLDKVVALAKRRGFIYSGSEIYGGLGGTWDYGPMGVELKNNLKKEFWKSMVQLREDVVGIDAAIIMNPKVWEASGHVEAFTDPLVECRICHKRFREDDQEGRSVHAEQETKAHGAMFDLWTEPKKFNLLVKSYLGVIEGKQSEVYLRGEITQGVHVNFKNILDSTRVKIPFGIAQIGKAFRNEITPGNFTFRSREFEQMELQFYIKPEEEQGKKWFEYWKEQRMSWYTNLGIQKGNLRFRDHQPDERAHYAREATDIEYDSPFGWKEFEGIHHRGDWDLSRHKKYSGEDLTYRDPDSSQQYLPWIIETSGGVDRAALFFMLDSFTEEKDRVILKLHPKLAPIKAGVFPLLANKPELVNLARKIYGELRERTMVDWDDRGNIGKRYASQDEIGTPFCVTVDFQSLDDNTVTIRNRDTTKQIRRSIKDLKEYFENELA